MTAKHLTRTKAGKAVLSLVVLALLALTLKSLAFSDASFTVNSSDPSNIFTAGSLSHTNDRAGGVIFDAAHLRPGLFKEGSVTISGGGSFTGAYTLTKGTVVDSSEGSSLSQTLALTVREVGAVAAIYDGSLSDWQTPLQLGAIAPATSRTYLLRLTYPAGSADSALDGATLTLPMTFTGTSP